VPEALGKVDVFDSADNVFQNHGIFGAVKTMVFS
jgi:hypothetical protein